MISSSEIDSLRVDLFDIQAAHQVRIIKRIQDTLFNTIFRLHVDPLLYEIFKKESQSNKPVKCVNQEIRSRFPNASKGELCQLVIKEYINEMRNHNLLQGFIDLLNGMLNEPRLPRPPRIREMTRQKGKSQALWEAQTWKKILALLLTANIQNPSLESFRQMWSNVYPEHPLMFNKPGRKSTKETKNSQQNSQQNSTQSGAESEGTDSSYEVQSTVIDRITKKQKTNSPPAKNTAVLCNINTSVSQQAEQQEEQEVAAAIVEEVEQIRNNCQENVEVAQVSETMQQLSNCEQGTSLANEKPQQQNEGSASVVIDQNSTEITPVPIEINYKNHLQIYESPRQQSQQNQHQQLLPSISSNHAKHWNQSYSLTQSYESDQMAGSTQAAAAAASMTSMTLSELMLLNQQNLLVADLQSQVLRLQYMNDKLRLELMKAKEEEEKVHQRNQIIQSMYELQLAQQAHNFITQNNSITINPLTNYFPNNSFSLY